jgi:hypothetical protein
MLIEAGASTNVLLEHAENNDLSIAEDNLYEVSFERAVSKGSNQPSWT